MAGCCGGCTPHPPPPPPSRPGEPIEIPPNRVIIKNFKGTIDKNQLFNKENVNWLEVVSGEIDSISEDFLFATAGLQRLIITGNKTFPTLTKNLFRNYPKLTYIDICYNDSLDIDEDAFTELKDLETLMLDEGRYTHVIVDPTADCGWCKRPPPPYVPQTEIPPNQVILENYEGVISRSQLQNKEKVNWIEILSGKIENISEDFLLATPHVERLVIMHNKTFPRLTKRLFRYYPKLTFVKICNNDSLEIDKDAFTELRDLRTLMLDEGTNITTPAPSVQFFTSKPTPNYPQS